MRRRQNIIWFSTFDEQDRYDLFVLNLMMAPTKIDFQDMA